MQVVRYQDNWSTNKAWLVKHYKDGHYYLNEEINGHVYYRRFQRTSLRYILQLIPDYRISRNGD